MRKPASAGFFIVENLNLNISMVLAKSAAEGLNISRNRYTVYLYSVRRETGKDQGVKVPDH
ncbi:TPA: hypothetical protein MD347_004346 [Klebsiella pneumoniae]|nr:hypothetical protein [Klebsiella pneumoniae]